MRPGLVLGTGLILEGANFAMASGVAAAETVIKAKKDGDFTAKTLAHYEGLLRSRFVMKELEALKRHRNSWRMREFTTPTLNVVLRGHEVVRE